jgi:hypothetical protein
MKTWVEGLTETKEFWDHAKWKEEQKEQFVMVNSGKHSDKEVKIVNNMTKTCKTWYNVH